MKTFRWALIACRVLSVACGLTLLNGGCGGEPSAISGGTRSEEEVKRDAETREAMEAASKAASKSAPKTARKR